MNIEQVVRDNLDNTIHMSLATTRDGEAIIIDGNRERFMGV